MKEPNLISIIIPLNSDVNDEKFNFYMQTILAQSYENIELIVVSNNPRAYRSKLCNSQINNIKYISYNYTKLYAAYNVGIELAQGEFLAFIDPENYWLSDKLTIQMAAFEDHPQLDGVFGYVQQRTIAKVRQNLGYSFGKAESQATNIPGYSPSTMLIRRKSWSRVGKFTDKFSYWHREALKSRLRLIMLPVIIAKRPRDVQSSGINVLVSSYQ